MGRRKPLSCLGCGTDVSQSEYGYVVHDDVWEAAGGDTRVGHGEDEFLCVGCLEERLCRRLTPDDFPDVPINRGACGAQSPRLLSRLREREENER